ncbi:hypothetical protein ACIA6T_19280 [Streptomyces sp. NPDC051740]|uniref:hypothetical protein n=1 Tax=Streptomyces sp. NPDC051740 TaxID=3365673 RepID=UPI00379326E3
MSEQPSIHNELSGDVAGHVVQSGVIHGDVVFSSPAAPMSRESAELRRRWEERQRRVLDAEDAQRVADQRRLTDYVRVIRRKRRWNLWVLLVESVLVMLGHLRVFAAAALLEAFALLFATISVFGWIHCSVIIKRAESGRTIRIPRSRWMW